MSSHVLKMKLELNLDSAKKNIYEIFLLIVLYSFLSTLQCDYQVYKCILYRLPVTMCQVPQFRVDAIW